MKKIINMNKNQKILTLISVIVIVATLVGSFSWAVLSNKTEVIKNTFSAATASTEIVEEFDNNIKKNVNIKNTGDIYGYVRIELVSYRVNENGDRIGGTAEIPEFTAGEGWLDLGNGLYIYSKAVAPKSKPEKDLIGNTGITLKEYTDVDGGKQVIDVIGEIIQSNPHDAVIDAWGDLGITVDKDGILSIKEDD